MCDSGWFGSSHVDSGEGDVGGSGPGIKSRASSNRNGQKIGKIGICAPAK